MELQSVKIDKLFGLFNYNIELNNAEDLTILTGPNGYGKTTILNIIYNLFNQRFFYFQKLRFGLITVVLAGDKKIVIRQVVGKGKQGQLMQIINGRPQIVQIPSSMVEIHVELYSENHQIDTFIYNLDAENKLARSLSQYIPVHRISSSNVIFDNRTGKQIVLREFLNENMDYIPDKVLNLIQKQGEAHTRILQTLNNTNVYLIKEQRLLKKQAPESGRPVDPNALFINTVEEYSKELKNAIEQKQLEAYQFAQKLDNSFPQRLIECKKDLQEDEFNKRFLSLNNKQNKLQQFGIATSGQVITKYDDKDARVLTVYLEDSEKKVSVYDDLLYKIELFVNILNEKRFAFKSIVIDGAQGFYFQSSNGERLNLADLSSGEQQEVVLLYELLFKTDPGTLILIDEPEISLHVIWQKTFVSDLQEIAKIKQISFLIATHSPQIINGRWDLGRDLFELAKGN
ncbi:MAG: AAA family ATPase [Odoribacteraceae bacterium]|jgi:predicted ATP-binding protein involved in virulence|nr:AAA family ATPase [Odoribacteraceae bacterium]